MSNVFDINVEDTAPVGAVYGRMPAQKRRSVQKTPKTPTTLSDLGSEVAGALPPTTRSKSKKATLSKISEALNGQTHQQENLIASIWTTNLSLCGQRPVSMVAAPKLL